jgi:PTH1 family peptidyl-tRNA hydrolase
LRLVVGLGNPGPSYKGTRHNVGRDFIDHVAREHGAEFSNRRQAEIIRLPAFYGLDLPKPVVFAKLDSFMNLSGPAIQGLCEKEGAKIGDTLIISDEFMIPFGALRIRPEGSAGGHNGLKSIIETFGTQEFPRLRVGVGPVPPGADAAEFVLARFTSEERAKTGDLLAAMATSLKTLFSDGMARAMNDANKVHL